MSITKPRSPFFDVIGDSRTRNLKPVLDNYSPYCRNVHCIPGANIEDILDTVLSVVRAENPPALIVVLAGINHLTTRYSDRRGYYATYTSVRAGYNDLMTKFKDLVHLASRANSDVKVMISMLYGLNLGWLNGRKYYIHPHQHTIERLIFKLNQGIRDLNAESLLFTPYLERLCHTHKSGKIYKSYYDFLRDGLHCREDKQFKVARWITEAVDKCISHRRIFPESFYKNEVLNQKCVEAGVLTAMALNCNLNMVSRFERKHYFYADLPAGYQITQQSKPLAIKGSLQYLFIDPSNPKEYKYLTAGITQLQLEQDSGKSLHDQKAEISLIDLNRAGMALMEIVTEPDFCSAHEAAAFVRELQLIMQTLGTCNGKMAEGSMRVDASVSLRRPGDKLGVRAEVKNINSVRNVAKAINYEIERQSTLLDNGQEVTNETRSYDSENEITIAMRDKEKVHDYRFLPEPNLPPLVLHTDASAPAASDILGGSVNVDHVRRQMVMLPDEKRRHLKDKYGITMLQAIIFVNDPDLYDYFLKMVNGLDKETLAVATNLLLNNLLGLLNKNEVEINSSPITPEMVREIAEMLVAKSISSKTAQKVLDIVFCNKKSPRAVVEEKNWAMITDESFIRDACRQVITQHRNAVDEYLGGKKKVYNFLVGELQKSTKGRLDPKLASQLLKHELQNLKK